MADIFSTLSRRLSIVLKVFVVIVVVILIVYVKYSPQQQLENDFFSVLSWWGVFLGWNSSFVFLSDTSLHLSGDIEILIKLSWLLWFLERSV